MRIKERERGFDKNHLVGSFAKVARSSHKIFCACKAASVDPAMLYFHLTRGLPGASMSKKKLSNLYANHKINYLEYRLLLPTPKGHLLHVLECLNINISEAGTTEYEHGFKDNALCAYALSEDVEIKQPAAYFNEKHFLIMELSEEWCSLYVTWNMAFLLSELDELDLILPKLFIPSVINAKPEKFMGKRAVSLWIAMNFDFFREVGGITHVSGPLNRREMAQAWGAINKKYAFALAKRELNENSREVIEHYRRSYAHPFASFIKRLVNFR
jgi:hypothetical protein